MIKREALTLTFGLFLILCMLGRINAETDFESKAEKFLEENGYAINSNSVNITTEEGIDVQATSIKKIQDSTFSVMSATSNEADSKSSLVILEKDGNKEYFISETYMQGNSNMLKMYNEDGGVILDLTNQKIILSYGNERKCGFLGCIGNYLLKNIGLFGGCATLCVVDFTFMGCAGCLGSAGAKGLWDCASNSCSWYKCKKDCTKKLGLGEYENYCFNGNVWKQRALFQYQCPADIDYGESGTCEINYDSGIWTNQTKVMTCQYGCNAEESACNKAPICNLITPVNNAVFQTKSVIFFRSEIQPKFFSYF